MRKLLVIILVTMSVAKSLASAKGSDYDALSGLSSQQLMDSGRDYFGKREAGKALARFLIVSERYKQSDKAEDTQLSIRALNNCACVYKYFYFDYAQAYEYFTRAYDLCKQVHYDEFLPVIMVNLGDLLNDYGISYNSQALSQQAQDIFEQCMLQAVTSQNWDLMTTAFFNLANQNYTLKLEKYKTIFDEKIPKDTRDLQYIRLQYRGLESVQQGHYAKARDYFQQQLATINAQWEPERDTLATYMSIAHTYRMENNYKDETEYLEKAFQLASTSNVGDQAASICKLLADSYQQQGNTSMQQHYHLLYLEKKEEAQFNKLTNIGELNYIHELKQEQERANELAESKERQQMLLITGCIVLLVVLGSAILLWHKNRQLHSRNKSLYEKNRQLLQVEHEAQELRKQAQNEFATPHSDQRSEKGETRKEEKYSRSNLSDDQRSMLGMRIEEILSSAEVVCEQDFTLTKLAKLVDSNTTYVSQVINEKYGTAFSNLLAGFRIKEACRRMNDETERYSQMTIEAIATGTGFKSRTTFVNAFKRETGLKPSEYLRMAAAKET